MKKFPFNPLRLFQSVIFGISLMVLVALYIAVGSGFARFRELFEMDELQFFNAWPLKLLMALLVINLVVVTWRRIPLTPPRYGVWCVHAGIILLILGTSYYYHDKVEGTTRLYTDPQFGPVAVDHFYDKDERALYLKVDGTLWNWYALPSLPRFDAYDASLGNERYLKRRDLQNLEPYVDIQDDPSKPPIRKSLSETLGWKDPLRLDVIGYYPYANINTHFEANPSAQTAGLRLTLPDMHQGENFESWLVSGDPRYRTTTLEGTELEHRRADAVALAGYVDSARKLYRLDVHVLNENQTIFVQVGQTYPIGKSGYSLTVENFDPAWPMSGTHEIVQALTVKVTSPAQVFRRMLLSGRDLQTDFKLGVPDSPPIGKRQKAPLDHDLVILFKFDDPYQLLPREGSIKHTLVTSDDKSVTDIVAGFSSPIIVKNFDSGEGDIDITAADPLANAPFAKMARGEASADEQTPPHPRVRLHFERVDHIQRSDSVQIVPIAQRTRDAGESGAYQVLRVKVSMGSWSDEVLVPYSMDAGDIAWEGGLLKIPGTHSTLQLQLGQVRRPLPARLTLNKFDLIPYPGGDTSTQSMMLDFRSTLTVTDPATGESSVDVAHMNNPVYFGDGEWLFFQAAYDGQDHHWTLLGVGNRHGIRIMILGFVMIVAGVLYAFYAKPIIIRRMKEKAVAKAAAKRSVNKDELLSVSH